MIEQQDDLSALSKWQKFLLCSSIILSPTYERNRHKFHLSWITYTKHLKDGIHQYREKLLTFNDNNDEVEKWWADCLYCTPFTEASNHPSGIQTNLLLTRAYDDKYSLYVLMEEYGVVRFKEYIENVPILMNSHMPFTDDPEYIPKSNLQ